MLTHVYHLHALTALHVGVGQAVGAVDLPIMRAKATNLPIVPGSAVKGVTRDEFAGSANQKTLFGPESILDGDTAHAGALAFGDAHLLILPVRSLAGITAFATCPFVLARYADSLGQAGLSAPDVPSVRDQSALLCAATCLKAKDDIVILEDLDLHGSDGADRWADAIGDCVHAGDTSWQVRFKERFAILSDDDFSFLADTATEIRARIRIGDRGVVADGALWYEENLPAESLLWGSVAADPARDGRAMDRTAVMSAFKDGIGSGRMLQIGGKATIGRGLVRFVI